MRYANPQHTMIRDDRRRLSIPTDPNNRHYQEILANGSQIEDYVAPSVDDTPTAQEELDALREAVLTGDKTKLQAIEARKVR